MADKQKKAYGYPILLAIPTSYKIIISVGILRNIGKYSFITRSC